MVGRIDSKPIRLRGKREEVPERYCAPQLEEIEKKNMHFLLILGIIVAIAAVAFALQNNTTVTVAFGAWSFDSSLAMVLLLALGVGAVIAISLSWPGFIKNLWASSRLRRQVNQLQDDKAMLEQRVAQLEEELRRVSPEPVPPEPPRYLGLKSILIGEKAETPRE